MDLTKILKNSAELVTCIMLSVAIGLFVYFMRDQALDTSKIELIYMGF